MKNPLTVVAGAFAIVNVACAQLITIDPTCAIQGIPGPLGLIGSVYHQHPPGSFIGLGGVGGGGYIDLIRSQVPNSNYVGGLFNYSGTSQTPTNAFLGPDSNGTAALDGTPIATTVFDMIGFLDVPAPGIYVFTLTSDDGSQFYLCGDGTSGTGTLIVNNDGVHQVESRSATVEFVAAGCYPIELVYFNTPGPFVGTLDDLASFNGTAVQVAGGPEPLSLHQTCVPEPSVVLLMLSSSLVWLRRRHRELAP